MTVLTVNNLPAATHGETVRCLFAIEMSRLTWVIAFNTPLSEKISRRTLTGCKWKRLLELIEEVRARVGRETGRAVEVISCYEAGCPVLPKKTRGGCIASGTVWSRNAFSMSTGSRGFARSKAFTITIRYARRR